MPLVTITIDTGDADKRTNRPIGNASIDTESIPSHAKLERRNQSMDAQGQSRGFVLGDLMGVIGAEAAATQRLITVGLTRSMGRLDAAAQKSLFEVDANETGVTNANFPRATGGSQPGN
ncbi:MAG: hypothetical protein AAFV88_14085 [Planctomycetota bacterium]